jgi:hypothetical protein
MADQRFHASSTLVPHPSSSSPRIVQLPTERVQILLDVFAPVPLHHPTLSCRVISLYHYCFFLVSLKHLEAASIRELEKTSDTVAVIGRCKCRLFVGP